MQSSPFDGSTNAMWKFIEFECVRHAIENHFQQKLLEQTKNNSYKIETKQFRTVPLIDSTIWQSIGLQPIYVHVSLAPAFLVRSAIVIVGYKRYRNYEIKHYAHTACALQKKHSISILFGLPIESKWFQLQNFIAEAKQKNWWTMRSIYIIPMWNFFQCANSAKME